MKNRSRIKPLDGATGIAIILVVYGHMDFGIPSHLYMTIRENIYSFHMSLFMFISGIVMNISIEKHGKTDLLRSKIRRFLPKYLLFSILFLCADIILSSKGFDQVVDLLINIVLYPAKASAGFLWYIYVLTIYYIILPYIKNVTRRYTYSVLIFSFFLSLVNLPSLFALDLIAKYLFFIFLSVVCFENWSNFLTNAQKYRVISLFIFVILMAFSINFGVINGVFSILVVFGFSNVYANLIWLRYVGRNSMIIYLLNTAVMGAIYVLVMALYKFEVNLISSLPLALSGVLLPLLVNRTLDKLKLDKLKPFFK